ncbi:hypothetical protein ACVR0P_07275 [Streptococcus castoreus]|nr:hypothetical protein [Streptococcus castoreus]
MAHILRGFLRHLFFFLSGLFKMTPAISVNNNLTTFFYFGS